MMCVADHRHVQTAAELAVGLGALLPRLVQVKQHFRGSRAFHLHVPVPPVILGRLAPLPGRRGSLILNEVRELPPGAALVVQRAHLLQIRRAYGVRVNRNSARFCSSSGSFSTQSNTSPCSSITEGAST